MVQDEADLDVFDAAARRRNTAGVVPAGAAGCKTTCRRPSTLVFFACSSGWPSKGSAGWAGAAPLGAASVIWMVCKQSPPPIYKIGGRLFRSMISKLSQV